MKPQQPSLTVDIIIVDYHGRIALVKRKNNPFKDSLALPGGFVEIGETTEEAAIREAREETGLDIKILDILGVYSKPDRDPRGHTVSICYLAHTIGGNPKAGSDAKDVAFIGLKDIPQLAFDHNKMIEDARKKYRKYLK